MALIQCPECQNDVSDSAKVCPHCGYKIKRTDPKKTKLIIGIVILSLIILSVLFVKFYYIPKVIICPDFLKLTEQDNYEGVERILGAEGYPSVIENSEGHYVNEYRQGGKLDGLIFLIDIISYFDGRIDEIQCIYKCYNSEEAMELIEKYKNGITRKYGPYNENNGFGNYYYYWNLGNKEITLEYPDPTDRFLYFTINYR